MSKNFGNKIDFPCVIADKMKFFDVDIDITFWERGGILNSKWLIIR